MAQNVQIPAGEDSYIQAAYSRPTEDSSAEWDSLLILMVHDFPGDKNSRGNVFHDLEFLLRDKGYHTLRFDFRGCGDSGGRQEEFTLATACEDFHAVLGWARKKGYKRFFLIGEGLGVSVSLMNIHADNIVCMVMLWPKIDLPLIAKTVFGLEEIIDSERTNSSYLVLNGCRAGVAFINELFFIDIRTYIQEAECAALVMHGAMDETSPIDQLDILRENGENFRRLEITSFHDGTHGLPQLNHRKAMYYHIAQFIEKYT